MIGEPYGSSTQQKCFQYSELPRQLDASLLITKAVSMNGGEALSLVNDKDERRLQLYTCSLLRKSRIERLQKRRPDISDWVKTRIISNNSNGSKRDPTVPPPTAESEILAVNQQIEQIYGTILKITQDIETDPSDLQKKNSTSLQVLHRLLDESKKRALYASSLLPTNNCRNVTAAALIAKATFVDAEIQDISLLQSHIQYLLQSKPDSISTQISHQLPNMHQ
jgi:hypothetical protein